jgi:hypothetical protein
MPKRAQIKAKRQRRTVDLADRYQEIDISAVAAALRCQKKKNPADRAWLNEKRRSVPA